MTLFRAFSHRNYRLFFGGQFVSLVGTWMQTIALSWLVYRLTGSAALLGAVMFAIQAPVFIVSPLGGLAADRFDRRKLLFAAQIAAAVPATILAILTLSGRIEIWQIFVLGSMLGVVNGFDIPSRQAFVVEMVGKEDLTSAIGLNSSLFNGSRAIGPAIAGVLVVSLGEGWCFALNAVSYIPIMVSLVAMKLPPFVPVKTEHSPLAQLREGFVYAAKTGPIRAVILLVGVGSFTAMSYSVLMPVFAEEIFGRGATGLGILSAASGAGAVAGALTLASRTNVHGLGRWAAGATMLCGGTLLLFSTSNHFWLSVGILIFIGYFLTIQFSSANTLIQTMVTDELRGRVMSIYSMIFMGMAPIGSITAGAMADRIGAPTVVAIAGAVAITGGLVFATRLDFHRAEAKRLIVSQQVGGPELP